MRKLKTYKLFCESEDWNKEPGRESSQNKLEQLKDCFLDLSDYGLEFNMELDEYNRIILEIKKPDIYNVDELTDMMEDGYMEWSDYYEKMAFDMSDDIINILKFANSYCSELGIRQGSITYNTYDQNPPYEESELFSYDNLEEFLEDYDSHGQVDTIRIIYVIKSESSRMFGKVEESLDHSDLSQNIDDAFSGLVDMGFDKQHNNDGVLFKADVVKVYKRYNPNFYGLKITGDIKDGLLRLHNDKREDIGYYGGDIYDVYDELMNALHIVSGVSSVNLKFSFTNFYKEDKIIVYAFEKIEKSLDHLSMRGVDPSKTYFVHDEESNNTYFFLYNLSGDCVGYQKYNPDNPKEGGLGWMGRYFTKVHKEATGHSKIAVYGLETYDMKKDYFFVTEGIFDIIKVHNTGEPGIANLGCSVSRQAKNWYSTLSQKKIVIQDRDDAGTELGTVGDYVYTVPEPYKDLGEMPQQEVNIFIQKIKKEIGI